MGHYVCHHFCISVSFSRFYNTTMYILLSIVHKYSIMISISIIVVLGLQMVDGITIRLVRVVKRVG